ncbi:MAG: DUF2087 domain-containing protein [Roseovarius sp.]
MRADDLTAFARRLSKQLGDTRPSHLKLINMLAKAAGYQNLQHMQSIEAATRRLDRITEVEVFNAQTVERALHQFDPHGRLIRWPSKRSTQTLALWVLWAVFPAKTRMHERELNALLRQEHLFDDPATLRRTMISCGLLKRKPDGTDYRRVEQAPSPEAKALIRLLSVRRSARSNTDEEMVNA